ncbi:hypothetical protein AAFP30_05650 [Gordonia sp. CPCC 205515]
MSDTTLAGFVPRGKLGSRTEQEVLDVIRFACRRGQPTPQMGGHLQR